MVYTFEYPGPQTPWKECKKWGDAMSVLFNCAKITTQ
jgi:hypothetical protein